MTAGSMLEAGAQPWLVAEWCMHAVYVQRGLGGSPGCCCGSKASQCTMGPKCISHGQNPGLTKLCLLTV
jgi:hypothetical protein